jgi:hypothetical protein
MTVTVKDLDAGGNLRSGEDVLRPRGSLTAGIALILFGSLGWAAGGKYTAEGWIIWLNWFLTWLGVPARVPPLQGTGFLLALVLAYLYSEVEVRHRPLRRVGKRSKLAPLPIVVLWLLMVGSDIGSTFQGVIQPGPEAWELTKRIASEPLLSISWSLILTFAPEWLISAGVRAARGK